MTSEVPPPAYDEVVASAPVPSHFSTRRLSRQDSLPHEAKQRLLREITSLREQTLSHLSMLRNLTGDIDRSYTTLKSNRSRIERDMFEWKTYLVQLIEKYYQENMQAVSEGFDTMEHKLVLNRQKVYQTYESSRQLCWSVDDQTAPRNHHSAQFLKRRFNEKLKEISLIKPDEVVADGSISSWRFIKPEVDSELMKELVGTVWQPFMEGDVVQGSVRVGSTASGTTATAPPLPTTNTSSEPAQPTPREDQTTVEPSPSDAPDSVVATPVESETRRPEHEESEPDQYVLLNSIQTKTFKDKTRCHPMSFAVDFDGNVIVADKFNQKIKIFTQRGQLIREITHPLLRAPTYITLTLAGDIAVSDSESYDVKFFSSDGILLGNVPKLPSPGGLTFNLLGDLIVTNTSQKAVHVIDTQVGVIKSSIQYYTGPDNTKYNYFQCPHYVATGHNDEIMVTDRGASNYLVFDYNRSFVGAVGKPGAGRGEFHEPYGISSYMGHGVIVADYSNHRIQRVDATGQFRDPILTKDDGLNFPTYAICTTDEKVMVSQYLSGEIKIFSGKSEHLEPEEALPPSYTDVVGEAGGADSLGAGFETPDMYGGTGGAVGGGEGFRPPRSPPPLLPPPEPPSWETSI